MDTSHPRELLEKVIDTISLLEEAKDLTQEQLDKIACTAIEQDKLEDISWLKEQVSSLPKTEQAKVNDPLEQITVSQPAKVASDDDLKSVLEKHSAWMASVLDAKTSVAVGRANLSGLDLSGYSLKGANLSCATLKNTTLVGADLTLTNFSRANLEGANLQGAKLIATNFTQARLTGADMRDADIEDTNFSHVDLKEITFDPAVMTQRKFFTELHTKE